MDIRICKGLWLNHLKIAQKLQQHHNLKYNINILEHQIESKYEIESVGQMQLFPYFIRLAAQSIQPWKSHVEQYLLHF